MSSAGRRRRPVFDPAALDVDDALAPLDPPAPRPSGEDDEPSATGDRSGNERSDGAWEHSTPEQPSTVGPARAAAPATDAVDRAGSPSRSRSAPTGRSRSQPSTTRQARSTRGRIATAVRLPADVYREVNDVLLSGAERPSYGQLVMWTLEDHRGEVGARVEGDLPDPSRRTPRGRRLAEDRVPIGLQLLSAERDELDDLAAEVSDRNGGERVTRTDVAVAALRVALAVRQHSPH